MASTHLALGVVTGDRVDRTLHRVALEPGGSLLLVSDGLIEAQDTSGRRFEMGRIEEAVDAAGSSSGVFETVRERVTAFTAGRKPHDDLSLVQLGLLPGDASQPTRILKTFITDRSIGLNLPACALKVTDPLTLLSNWPGTLSFADDHRSRLYTVLAELVNNAIEHGLLGLDPSLRGTADKFHDYYRLRDERLENASEGFLKVSVEREAMPGGLLMRIRVEDSGPGFDVSRALANPQSLHGYHGRGIALARALGTTLQHLGCGNTVEPEYCKPAAARQTDLAA